MHDPTLIRKHFGKNAIFSMMLENKVALSGMSLLAAWPQAVLVLVVLVLLWLYVRMRPFQNQGRSQAKDEVDSEDVGDGTLRPPPPLVEKEDLTTEDPKTRPEE